MKLLFVAVMLIVNWTCYVGAGEVANAATNTAPKFYCVTGDGVFAPGRFTYEEGVTLSKAIKVAGGCTSSAIKNKVQLIRRGELRARDVDLSQIELGKTNDLKLQPGDYVLVEERRRGYQNVKTNATSPKL